MLFWSCLVVQKSRKKSPSLTVAILFSFAVASCLLKEEGEEDGVDRERCWYVKEGLFVAKRDWRLMLTVGWREGGNGLL